MAGKADSRRPRRPGAGARLALLAGAILLPLLLIELGLRLAGAGGPLELEPLYDRDEVHYLREEPWKPAGVWATGPYFRIAVIGDSFTVGQGVQWDSTYPYRLLDLLNLNRDAPPTILKVFAEEGVSTMDEVRFLEPAIAWKADLILIGIFLNDAEHASERRERRARLPRPPAGPLRPLTRGSRLAEIVYERFENLRLVRAERSEAASQDFDSRGWRDFDTALGIFADRTAEADVQLAAAILPSMHGLGPGYDRSVHDKMGEILTRRGIPHHDLLEDFIDKSPERMQVYPGVDAHPSEIGHRIIARSIFDFLLDEGILGEEFRPRAVAPHWSRQQWLRQLRRYRDVVHYEPPAPAP